MPIAIAYAILLIVGAIWGYRLERANERARNDAQTASAFQTVPDDPRNFYEDDARDFVTVLHWTDRHGVKWMRVFDSDAAALECEDALPYQRTFYTCPIFTRDDK